ncbi:MAG: hypothetical protein WB239_17830 [Acidimicrobiia bacterium]
MSSLVCRLWRRTLAAWVLDTGYPPPILDRHVATCLRCQAVVASSRRLRRELAGLDADLDEVSGDRGRRALMAAGLASVAAVVVLTRLRQKASTT